MKKIEIKKNKNSLVVIASVFLFIFSVLWFRKFFFPNFVAFFWNVH